jgi:glutathione S-transferase
MATSTSTGTSEPLVFYDISSFHIPNSYAPNPSKTRYTLSFKAIPFTTRWTDILDIPATRQRLKCPVTRKHVTGEDYPTLPMLQNTATGEVLGDSFDIAEYLDIHYPFSGAGRLFLPPSERSHDYLSYRSPNRDTPFMGPPLTEDRGSSSLREYAEFNVHVDCTFTSAIIPYGYYLPFNPSTAQACKEMFCARSGRTSWEEGKITGDARRPFVEKFQADLKSLAALYEVNAGKGPFLEGEKCTYADIIVGGWLVMYEVLMPKDEWRELRDWYGGVFGRLHDTLRGKYWTLT